MAIQLSTLSSDGLGGTPSGGGAAYQTMAAWENGQQGSLAPSDSAVLECYNYGWAGTDGGDNESVAFDWDTTGTGDVTIRAAAGSECNGIPRHEGGTGFLLYFDSTYALRQRGGDLVLEDIEFQSSGGNGAFSELLSATGSLRAERCIFELINTPATTNDTLKESSAELYTQLTMRSCLIINRGGYGNALPSTVDNANLIYENNTHHCYNGRGVWGNGTSLAVNCASWASAGAARECFRAFAGGSDNSSSDATAPGTNAITTLVDTTGVDWVDASTFDFNVITTSPALSGNGNAAVLPLDDIRNTAFISPPERGCFTLGITLVQSNLGSYGASASATFPVTPTDGNLLVCTTSHRTEQQVASLAGWTKIFQRDAGVGNSTTRRSQAVFAKLAGASEPTNVQPVWSLGASSEVAIGEFQAGVVGEEWDPVIGAVFAANDNDPTQDVTSISTGITASSANQLGVIFGSYKNYTQNRIVTFAATGYADVVTQVNASTNDQIVGALWTTYTGTGTRSELMTVTTNQVDTDNRGLISSLVLFGHSGGVTFDGPDIVAQTGGQDQVFTFDENSEGNVDSRFTNAISYAYSAGSDQPAGITVNATTGNLEGTPTASGIYNVTIEGSD